MKWNWKKTRSKAQHPDPESGTWRPKAEQPTDGDPRSGEQPNDDDSDNNDKFWKLFLEEAISEAQWKVSIRQTELDSLLVFAGLFAGVVSAFLVDLRSHLRPDPQLMALKELASILRNDTAPVDVESPRNPVIAAGFLWYGSLVVTLIGALWGVLAKGWLGEILRETPNNPADRALERWRRDKAARHWYMDNVITGVPLLIQVGLAMFLSGFVVQSFDDYHTIGLEVLVYVILGACAYALFTILPWFRSDCPYRTPLTNFFPLASHDTTPIVIGKGDHDSNTKSKIKILMSRLNRSSNDEIFCSAAAMLDVKLESHDSEKWYKGVVLQKKAADIAEALSVRLKSFAHRVQTIPEGPSLSILKNTASSGSTSGQAVVGALYSPIEQGVACLRILLKSIEASISSEGDKSPWIKKDIDRQWRLSKTFPDAWRLLSLNIHITRLVARKDDYDEVDIVAIDWESMISKTFSDLALRSMSGASACRGLLHGKDNLKRVCAVGLAMFIEIEATGSPKQNFFDMQTAKEKGKVITEKLWNELVNIWKDAVVQMLGREVHEWDEPENSLIDSELLTKELYQNDIESLISKTIHEQLGNKNWATRKQAIRMLTRLSEQDVFQEVIKTSGVILKVITLLKDDDDDVRAAVVKALSTFGEQDVFTETMKKERALPQLITTLTADDSDVQAAAFAAVLKFSGSDNETYLDDIKSSIPTMLKQLEDTNWSIREKAVQILMKLSDLDIFDETMNTEGTIQKIVVTLEDGDSDVRTAAVEALQAFSAKELYQDNIKLSIPTVIKQLDNESWEICRQNIQIILKLTENDAFSATINEGAIPKIVAKLENDDSDVRDAAVECLQAFSKEELYQNNIKLSIPIITKLLDNEYWGVRQQAVQTLVQLFAFEEFRETLITEGMIAKIFAKLKDDDSDVRAAAVAALQGFSSEESYYSDLKSSVPTIMTQLNDENWKIRQQAIGMLKTFSNSDVFKETLKTNGAISKFIAMLEDDDEDVRVAAVEAVSALCIQDYFKETMSTENSVSKLSKKLTDDNSSVRSAAFQAMSMLGAHEIYSKEIKSKVSVSTVVNQLADENWSTRQQAVQTLSQFATNVDFQMDMNTEKIVSKIAAMLTSDTDDDVRTASAQALSVFGAQETFQKALKSEKVIPKLTAKMSDSYSNVRSAIQSTMLALSTQVFYQNDIKSAIPILMGQLEDSGWAVRQQVIQTLEKLSEQPVFQETLKTEGSVAKLVAKLEDSDEDVRAAAAHALSTLGSKDQFKDRMKAEKAIPKLVAQLTDEHDTARDAVHEALLALGKQKDVTGFLQTVVSALNTVDKVVRTAVYKLLAELKESRDSDDFLNEIDTAICELLIQMKDKDISFIRRSIAILTETADEELQGDNLQSPNSVNRSARDAVEAVVRSKLAYEKNSPDRNDVVLTLSRLAKHEVFQVCMRPAIPALIEAVGSNDRSARSTSYALEAISTLSTNDDFRADLVPAIQKLVQKLNGWDDDEVYPLDLIKALPALAEYKEFQNKLKHIVPMLMEKLQKDLRNNTLDQDSDKNKVAFYQEACKLISKLCEDIVGRELVPHLIRVLSNMHASLTKELLDVVTKLIDNGNLTMNDRIALASSLRILSPVHDNLEVLVCKLTMAALLDEAHNPDAVEDAEYSTFLGAVLGDGNETIKSKLSMLIPPAPTT